MIHPILMVILLNTNWEETKTNQPTNQRNERTNERTNTTRSPIDLRKCMQDNVIKKREAPGRCFQLCFASCLGSSTDADRSASVQQTLLVSSFAFWQEPDSPTPDNGIHKLLMAGSPCSAGAVI